MKESNRIIMTFERIFGPSYSVREKYFYVLLREFWSAKKPDEDWVFLNDDSKGKPGAGFRHYGLSARVCKSARKKLTRDGLLECKYVHGTKGYRIGTAYRLLDERFTVNSKIIHTTILNELEQGSYALPKLSPQNQGVLSDI